METLIRNFEIPLYLPLQKGETLGKFRFIRKVIIINQKQTEPRKMAFDNEQAQPVQSADI
jgi:hypothetical protein